MLYGKREMGLERGFFTGEGKGESPMELYLFLRHETF
jgi:hypothetical protein